MRNFLILVILLVALTACQQAAPADPTIYARKLMHNDGKDSAKITNVVHGDKKYRQADELWCVETDADNADGTLPYLLAVWRKGDQWDGVALENGYYEWDLYGCPRPQ